MGQLLVSICKEHFLGFYYVTFVTEFPTIIFNIVRQIVATFCKFSLTVKEMQKIVNKPDESDKVEISTSF